MLRLSLVRYQCAVLVRRANTKRAHTLFWVSPIVFVVSEVAAPDAAALLGPRLTSNRCVAIQPRAERVLPSLQASAEADNCADHSQ